MVIAGMPHPEVPIAARIEELGLQEKVQVLGFQELDDLDGYIAACDVVLNLRWPTFGETSGIAMRAFGLGKTVVVSDSGSDREWPDDVCVRIPCDRFEEEVLAETLRWLVSDPAITAEIGASAARFVRENCDWDIVAHSYAEFIATYRQPPEAPSREIADAASARAYLARWAKHGTDAEVYLTAHENRLVRTLQLTPAGHPGDRVLEMGCYLQITPALRDLAGYGEVRGCYLGKGGANVKGLRSRDGDFFECTIDLFDCETDPFPYPNDHFSTVLCCELLEHLSRDPMRTLTEIHRILKPHGTLVLTTPNIVSMRALSAILQGSHPGFYCRYPDPDRPGGRDSKHEREYTPVEVSKLLTAAGFVVDHIETGPYNSGGSGPHGLAAQALKATGQSMALRDDCIFALGRKAELPREFRPYWLYDSSPGGEENS
jgi:SAM-dependent methyltransferase